MTFTEPEKFKQEREANISAMAQDADISSLTLKWICETARYKYTYNFQWLGRPIIQFPEDMFAMQELIWQVKPRLIIETGIAHGGSIIFYASMLELLGGEGMVLGIDIDIRQHNRVEIERHPMFKRIKMIEGSSVGEDVIQQVYKIAHRKNPIMLVLDSNHTHEHVLAELNAYSSLVSKGSYLVVFDTIVEDMPADFFQNRSWGKGNNPKSAILEFLRNNDRFEIDREFENKLLITVAPSGHLKCIKD